MSIQSTTDLAARIKELGLLDPTSRLTRRRPDAPRLGSLRGKRAGFLDNRKGNANVLLERLREVLTAEYGLTDSVVTTKWGYSYFADPDLLKDLAERCDFVVTAIGD